MASLALLIWPVCALILFRVLSPLNAVIWAILLPYLFLPEAKSINLPGLPDLTKTTVIAVSTLLGLIFFRSAFKPVELGAARKTSVLKVLLWTCLGTILLGYVFTVFNNGETLRFGDRSIPGARPWDIVSQGSILAIGLIPFLVSMRYLATAESHRALLRALVIGTLIYTLLMLIEIRLSPQLHRIVYGYFQHDFVQHIRDGFRPMVFLQHGLWVGFFVFMGLLAAFGLWRSEKNSKWLLAGLWILAVLAISQNLGALVIAILLCPVLLILHQRLQIGFAVLVTTLFLIYPGLRQAEVLPLDRVINMAASVSNARALSLEFRFDNEDLLLDRARRKPLTGWGGWNRSRVYDEEGRNISTTDGRWIIILGEQGWIGYLAYFGLLTLPIFALMSVRRRHPVPIETITLMLIGTGNLIYMLPNATLTPIGLMVFGSIAGFCISGHQTKTAEAPVKSRQRRTPRYTRFGNARLRT